METVLSFLQISFQPHRRRYKGKLFYCLARRSSKYNRDNGNWESLKYCLRMTQIFTKLCPWLWKEPEISFDGVRHLWKKEGFLHWNHGIWGLHLTFSYSRYVSLVNSLKISGLFFPLHEKWEGCIRLPWVPTCSANFYDIALVVNL